jgi:hypothetical protein
MCFKASQTDREERDARRGERQDAERRPPSENPHPRGNGDLDHQDVVRGIEKLTALVGR